jgi:hypothetical protein
MTSLKAMAVGTLAIGSVLLGVGLDAQRTYRIGIITFAGTPVPAGAASSPAGPPMPIKDLLAARGYREGENVVYLYRAAGRDEALVDRYAKELVDWKADLVISQMTNSDIAMKKATDCGGCREELGEVRHQLHRLCLRTDVGSAATARAEARRPDVDQGGAPLQPHVRAGGERAA